MWARRCVRLLSSLRFETLRDHISDCSPPLDTATITERFAMLLSHPHSVYHMTIWIFSAADFIFEDTGAPLVQPGAEKGHRTGMFLGLPAYGDGGWGWDWTGGTNSLHLKCNQAPRIFGVCGQVEAWPDLLCPVMFCSGFLNSNWHQRVCFRFSWSWSTLIDVFLVLPCLMSSVPFYLKWMKRFAAHLKTWAHARICNLRTMEWPRSSAKSHSRFGQR